MVLRFLIASIVNRAIGVHDSDSGVCLLMEIRVSGATAYSKVNSTLGFVEKNQTGSWISGNFVSLIVVAM